MGEMRVGMWVSVGCCVGFVGKVGIRLKVGEVQCKPSGIALLVG